jgi:WD40 repeat protein
VATSNGGRSDAVRSVALSPDGTRIASGVDDVTIKVWDWKKEMVCNIDT